MMLDLVETIIGPVPAGWEVLAYVFAGMLGILVVRTVLGLFGSVAGMFGGRR